MQRVILHCDMNNFYASVECMLNPELKNKPVAVCGSVEERHGIVLAKNYAAKAFGVSTGEAIWQAKQKCQNLVIVEPHYEQYMKFSKLARGIYGRYTDQIEPYGMDECWLDVTGSGCMGTGFEIADEIRRTVKFELGLTISAGVSFNKIFAKLGSDMKKPDAITCIEADSFQEKIWCLPASDLLGVGRATEKVLSGYGIHTIGELAATSDDFLKCRLGKNGLAIKKYANGLDDSPVMRSDYVSPVKSIGHGITTIEVDGSQRSIFLKTNDVVLDKSFIEPENIRKLCGKRRFTLAHECAHQILFQLDADDRKIACHKRPEVRKKGSRVLRTQEDWNEWQANSLGAAILMPQLEVDRAMWFINSRKPLT